MSLTSVGDSEVPSLTVIEEDLGVALPVPPPEAVGAAAEEDEALEEIVAPTPGTAASSSSLGPGTTTVFGRGDGSRFTRTKAWAWAWAFLPPLLLGFLPDFFSLFFRDEPEKRRREEKI